MKTIFYNGTIFTGKKFLDKAMVVVKDGRVSEVDNARKNPGANALDLEGGYLVPAFIDLQLYGGNGNLFGEHPSIESLRATYAYSLAGGAAHIMPTVATNSTEVMYAAIEAVKNYWYRELPGILGLHLEGPYINPQKKGAHIEQFIHKPTLTEVKELMQKGKGIVKMMTLAPEVCDSEVIQYLQQQGVIISAGHTNATYEEATDAFQNGIPLATHLYNAMSALQHRAPGMVGAIFNSEKVMASVVADGHHVDYAAIRIAKKIMGNRLFLITDAVAENAKGYYQHRLAGDKYVVADGTLSGSALTILKAIQNCITHAGIKSEEALRMGSLYPARAIRHDHELGKIKEGYKAEFAWLNKDLGLKAVYTNGLPGYFE